MTNPSPVAPDFAQIGSDVDREAPFPAPVEDEFRVHFTPEAHRAMRLHADATDEVELGGVLIGHVGRDERGPWLQIVAVIEGEKANNYGAQVTFTHDTWSHINEVKDRDHPGERIVGWYHTHPGFGVFLSKMDMFIQENFFGQPYQVAVVVETRSDAEGCFAWRRGKATPLTRYWVGEEEVTLAKGEAEEFDGEPEEMGPAARRDTAAEEPPWWSSSSVTLAAGALLCIMIGFFLSRVLGGGPSAVNNDLEAEAYTMVEAAAAATLIRDDLRYLADQLEAVRGEAEKTGQKNRVAELKAIENYLGRLDDQYARRHSENRRALKRLLRSRQALTNRIVTVQRRQDAVVQMTLAFYQLRLADMVGEDGFDPEEHDESKRRAIKRWLDVAMRLSPASKRQFQHQFPGLIEYYYPKEGGGGEDDDRPELQGEGD